MNEAQEWLLKVGLNDKCIGTMKRTKKGKVIVSTQELLYLSDLMEYWKNRKIGE
jgi:hypothetical protein